MKKGTLKFEIHARAAAHAVAAFHGVNSPRAATAQPDRVKTEARRSGCLKLHPSFPTSFCQRSILRLPF